MAKTIRLENLIAANSFIQLLEPYFEIQETYLHFFPARTLPFKLPQVYS